MQGPATYLDVATYPPGATDTQERLVLDGTRGAIFLYANGGPVGSLVGSWASVAGTDPYGNPYPAGFSTTAGSSTIDGSDYIINSNGMFFYNGVPAAGNLIASFSSLDGTDPFGNPVIFGDPTFYTGNTMTSQFTAYRGNGVFAGIIQNGDAGTSQLVINPQGGIAVNSVDVFDPVAGYPTAETWHPIPLNTGAGWAPRGAGYATPSYKMLPSGDVMLGGEVTNTSAANASVIGTLPSKYYSAVHSFNSPPAMVSGAANPAAGQTFRVGLTTAGQLGFYGVATTGAYTISLDGIVFPISIG